MGANAASRPIRGSGAATSSSESASRSIPKPTAIRSITELPVRLGRVRGDHAAQQQPLAGPRGGDVEEAQLLLGLASLQLLAEDALLVELDPARAEAAQLHPHPG